MEIRKPNNSQPDRGKTVAQGLERIARASEKNAQEVRQTKERIEAQAAQVDRLELSQSARELQASERGDEKRAQRIAEIKTAHNEGRLNTPERVAKAAEKMLRARTE